MYVIRKMGSKQLFYREQKLKKYKFAIFAKKKIVKIEINVMNFI